MTGGARYTGRSDGRDKSFTKRDVIKYVVLVIALCVLSVMQTSFFKVNGNPVGITLLFVLATGLLFGERDGGIVGLVGGLFVDCLGGGIIYISPLIYAAVGYFGGVSVKRLLSSSLPSYIVYTLIVGIIKQAQNLFYFVMLSDNFNLMQIFIGTLVPDYIAFVLFSPLVYGFAYLIFKLVNIRKNKKY